MSSAQPLLKVCSMFIVYDVNFPVRRICVELVCVEMDFKGYTLSFNPSNSWALPSLYYHLVCWYSNSTSPPVWELHTVEDG